MSVCIITESKDEKRIFSVKTNSLCVSFFSLVYGKHDYSIVGYVENIIYVPSKAWPCYVAVSSVESGQNQYDNYYHAAYNTDQCGFAERAKHFEFEVKLYGEKSTGNNNLLAIEYAKTNAKFQYPERALP